MARVGEISVHPDQGHLEELEDTFKVPDEQTTQEPVFEVEPALEPPSAEPQPELEVKETKVDINKKVPVSILHTVQGMTFQDPFDKSSKPDRIDLLSFLEREFKDSYFTRSQKNKGADMVIISRMVQHKIPEIEDIRALAEACRSEAYWQDITDKLADIDVDLDKLDNRFDSAKDFETDRLLARKRSLETDLATRKAIGNEIYHYLTEVAETLETKPQFRLEHY